MTEIFIKFEEEDALFFNFPSIEGGGRGTWHPVMPLLYILPHYEPRPYDFYRKYTS